MAMPGDDGCVEDDYLLPSMAFDTQRRHHQVYDHSHSSLYHMQYAPEVGVCLAACMVQMGSASSPQWVGDEVAGAPWPRALPMHPRASTIGTPTDVRAYAGRLLQLACCNRGGRSPRRHQASASATACLMPTCASWTMRGEAGAQERVVLRSEARCTWRDSMRRVRGRERGVPRRRQGAVRSSRRRWRRAAPSCATLSSRPCFRTRRLACLVF